MVFAIRLEGVYNSIKEVAHAVLSVHGLDGEFVHCRDKSLCAFQQVLVDRSPISNALLNRETILVGDFHSFDKGRLSRLPRSCSDRNFC